MSLVCSFASYQQLADYIASITAMGRVYCGNIGGGGMAHTIQFAVAATDQNEVGRAVV